MFGYLKQINCDEIILRSVSTFSAVLGPLFLLPFGRPLGRFGVGGPTGSCEETLDADLVDVNTPSAQ